ncbi:MAG: GNAT family N-acetyltransferase [Acidobacteria bacterium]|jgi:hypothetical protein|nr:GNAT family N-acetyltransferase [Acidobacteriota bacterium]
MKPVVRLYRDGDEQAINDGFNRAFGKQRSVQEWAWKYRAGDPPYPIVAAWDGQQLAAHNGGVAADYQVYGQQTLAIQGADTFSLAAAERNPEWRGAWQQVMERFAELAADEFGASLLYGFTGGRAISHMVARAQWDSVSPRRIPLLTRHRRPAGRSAASRLFSARLVGEHYSIVDRLWARASNRYPVSVVRDGNHVRRRLTGHPTVRYHRFIVRPRWSSAPAAFVAFRADGGVIRWVELVWDGRPGSLELVDLLSRGLAEQTGAEREELWLDGDPEAARWLEVFGFESRPDPSGVVRVVKFLSEDLKAESFAPGGVYTTMADADLV